MEKLLPNPRVEGNLRNFIKSNHDVDFPGGSVVGSPPANEVDMGSSLVQEGSTSCGTAEPVCHNY